jgi:hypothetical protein
MKVTDYKDVPVAAITEGACGVSTKMGHYRRYGGKELCNEALLRFYLMIILPCTLITGNMKCLFKIVMEFSLAMEQKSLLGRVI